MPRRLNTLPVWPHLHICSLDPECWKEMWLYGLPFRIYYGTTPPDGLRRNGKPRRGYIADPIFWPISHLRHRVLWRNAETVEITAPPPLRKWTGE